MYINYLIICFLLLLICLLLNNETFNNLQLSKIIFISYGGPSYNYHGAVKRICKEAKNFDLFTDIIEYTELDLHNNNIFWDKHSKFILNNKRGYGYWIWKSYLNLQVLNNLSAKDDIIVYADAGCEFNIEGKDKMLEYIELLKKSEIGILVFNMPWFTEKHWTKMDLVDKLNCYEHIDSPQIFATWFMYKNCDHSVMFINEWYNLCCDYHNIDDSSSIISNDQHFMEHRHDQSVFSLLCKKFGAIIHSQGGTNFPPIIAAKNRFG